ncbi:hypothetical protein AB0I28_12260 [Phytomonospora sp. NPDC050363]|uniref:hypothetical protein n=1 Tax=Phytomonospora sp. NPDC050363 TaxID=3155642 RepID=UPI0033F345BD
MRQVIYSDPDRSGRQKPSFRQREQTRRWGRRSMFGTYRCNVANRDSLSDDVRRAQLKTWLDSVWLHFKKAEGWGKLKTIAQSKVGRTTVHGWEVPWDSPNGRKPTMDKMMQFCATLKIDASRPFEVMGWTTKTEGTKVDEPADTPAMRTIKYKLAHPELDDRERYYLGEELDRLAARPLKAGESIQVVHES